MIHPARVTTLAARPERRGRWVLYWMQQAQRTRQNHALEHAVGEANARGLPLLVGFGLTNAYPDANLRHYAFMLQGLRDVARELDERGIRLVVRRGSPDDVALGLAEHAALVVCDVGYLRHQKAWRRRVAEQAECTVVAVETDVVVPVEQASDKREYAARTLRPKIEKLWDQHLQRLVRRRPQLDSRRLRVIGDLDLEHPELDVDRSVLPVRRFTGGSREAERRLRAFIRSRLEGYAGARNEPAAWHVSLLGPYLHFGQISPVDVALRVRNAGTGSEADVAALLEQLIVRRELAANYVHFTPDYDRWSALPDWAKKTLTRHAKDRRPRLYDRKTLDAAQTHDPYWNAAMRELVHTGYMHNTLRMYWAKKILEWSPRPEQALRTTIELNNRYFLDGRDPSSYANVWWCFGLHDRPWAERPIYGSVRSMTAAGLERKYDMDAYQAAVEELVRAESG